MNAYAIQALSRRSVEQYACHGQHSHATTLMTALLVVVHL